MRATLRASVPALALLLLTGCEHKPWWNPQLQMANDHSVADGTQTAVVALPGWGGGCYWPFVNLFSGNLVLRQSLFGARALGFDWDLVLYYNSTLAGTSGVLGPGWRHSYEMSLQIDVPVPGQITALWGDGRTDVFTFDGGGWSAAPGLQGRRITAIAGGEYRLQDKHGMRYEYDAPGRLVRTVDRNGHTTVLSYLGSQLQSVTDASGRVLQFLYDFLGRLERVQGLPPQPAEFQYDGLSRLVRVVHPYVGDHVYSYDAMDRLVRAEDASGRATRYEYWLATPATREARADGAVRRFDYDQATLRTTVSDSVDIATAPQTRYTFDAQGRCLGVDGPLGVTNNTYTPLNQIDAHTDADGHVTQYQYDPLGNLLRRIRPSTAQVEWTYDPVYNLPLTFTNELGKIWTLDYDPNGNLFKVTDPLGGFREYTYDGLSRRITVTDEDTRTTTFGYDAWSNVDRITDPAGHLIQLSRNVRGAVEQVTDQAGNLWQIHRGPKDEVASVEPPGPFAQFQLLYTAAGLLDVVTDPLGAPVRYAYDGLSRLVRREDPFGMPTTVERDGAGRVRRLTDASGAAETYTRDPAGRVTSVLDADGGMRSYIYNFCDLTDAIDALGNPAMFSYDLDHRPVRVQWPGITEDYAYDAADRLIRAERTAPGEPLIRELHTYDDANRRIQTQQTHLGRTVDYTYSPAGDALTVADNLQPLALTIGYNTRHLPVFAGAGGVPPVTAVYDSRSQIQTLAYSGSSLKSLYTYDAIGRLLTTSNQSASFLATYNAVYNVRGDREQVTGTSPAYGPYQHLVGFDLKRRITSEQIVPGPAATTYSYDPVDDRQQVDPPFGPLYTYSPGHRLLSGGTMTQLWDANGSVTQLAQPTRTLDYTYGADGRLTAISDGVQTWRFTHGPGGTLARVTLPGAIHRWLATDRGPRGPLRHVVLPAPGLAPALERIYAIDRGHSRDPAPVAEIRGAHATPNFRGLLTAYDGSVVQSAQANAPGTPEAERYFDRFGMVRWHAGAPQPEVGFQGMSGIVGLDSLWTQPLHVRPRLVFVRPNGPDALPPIVVDVVTCSPNSGTAQSDRGLGSDATPLNHDYFGYFDWMIKMWNYWRSRLIEEGFKGSLPPPIDWPPDPPFGPIPGGYGMVPGPPLEGLPGGALIELDDILGTLDAFPWVRDVDPNFHFDSPWMTDFHPGIQDPNQSSEPY